MKILIVGCGKLGAGLALELYKKGHTISIIDKDEDSFYRLGADFNGTLVVGNGYDQKVLEEAEIEYADAMVCATGNDEINAVAAKIGKDKYYVKYVIARLYNPRKAKVYEALGIKAIFIPPRKAAKSFSLSPPIGRTSPRKVISPVMATSARTGLPVIAETMAVTIPTPADGPSFGVAPSGT